MKSTQPSLDDGALQGLGYFNGDNGSINISMFEDDNEYLSTISRLSSSTGVLCLFPLRNAKDLYAEEGLPRYRPRFLPHEGLGIIM